MKRVVVTGMGCLCATGNSIPEYLHSLRESRCGIGPLSVIPTDALTIKIGADVKGFDPGVFFKDQQLAFLDRNAQLAIVAAREAVASAGELFVAPASNGAAILGTGIGGKISDDVASARLYQGDGRVHPLTIVRVMPSAAVSQVSMDLGITGPVFSITSACASSNHAIGEATRYVRAGLVDWALAGGTEAGFTFGLHKAWEAMRILAPDTCRPFSADRRGLVLGEGAGVIVLESLEHAQARGANILAEIIGYGASSDASHITQPSDKGAAQAMRLALKDAGLKPEDVDYINAHGTGTPTNDVTETRAIKDVFGEHAKRLAVSSTKSMHGHALGAAGAIELIATILAVRHGFLPATANYTIPDPECDLDYVPNQARPKQVRVALSNSFAFGGLNAVLAVRQWPN